MAEKTRAALKAQMATGTVLNEAKLADLVDSGYNKIDDDLEVSDLVTTFENALI